MCRSCSGSTSARLLPHRNLQGPSAAAEEQCISTPACRRAHGGNGANRFRFAIGCCSAAGACLRRQHGVCLIFPRPLTSCVTLDSCRRRSAFWTLTSVSSILANCSTERSRACLALQTICTYTRVSSLYAAGGIPGNASAPGAVTFMGSSAP
jgi:hypothetical protein